MCTFHCEAEEHQSDTELDCHIRNDIEWLTKPPPLHLLDWTRKEGILPSELTLRAMGMSEAGMRSACCPVP